ncbi:MAG: hypothetical protein K8S87_10780 [Planctomycetes bacterium]|nr:hypothetical protein [Planctomycetota bacterium]
MIYFIDSSAFSNQSETLCSQSQSFEFMANLDDQKAKKAICANYQEFHEKCKKNKTIINTRLEKLNAYFKDKYPDFPGISLTDDF